MSLLLFMCGLPMPVLLALIGCIFVLFLLLILLIVFVPTAAERIGFVMDIFLHPYYPKKRIPPITSFQDAEKKDEASNV
jgi:cell division protein FtsW (lipid II flippase)